MTTPWGTQPLLADTSAWARAKARPHPWDAAVRGGQIVTCGVVELELLYSARTQADVERLRERLSSIRHLPVTLGHVDAAIGAVVELASTGADGHHRVPPADAIIAACAAERGCGVLHYDRHYDRLGEVLGFDSVWLASAGELA